MTPSAPVVPRPVKGLGVVSLFNDFASEMVYPLLPAFVTTVLGGGAVALGALDGAADLTAAAVKWWSGRLADRTGWRKPLILGGYLTAILIRPVTAFAGAAWQVVAFRVIDRVGKGARTPARDAMIADLTPPASRGRAFGFHRAADHFGAVLGSLAAWALLRSQVDIRTVLEWSILPGLLAFVVLTGVLRGVGNQADGQPAPAAGADPAGGVRFWGPVLLLAALTFCRLPETLLLLRLQDLGVPLLVIPLVWAGLHVVRTVASYPGGWLADHLGARTAVGAGALVFAGLLALLGQGLREPLAVGIFLLLGVFNGLTEPAERSLVAALSPGRTGRGFGGYHAVTGLAALPAGLLFGAIYQQLGGPAALLASAASVGVVTLAWFTAPALRGR